MVFGSQAADAAGGIDEETLSQWLVAAENGRVRVLQRQIKATPQIVNARDEYGWTALHRACVFGQSAAVQMLLSWGADVNAKDKKRKTPLHDCATGLDETAPAMAMLVKAGALIEARDTYGYTPLMVAVEYTNLAGVMFLLACGAKTDWRDRRGRDAMKISREAKAAAVGRKYAWQRQQQDRIGALLSLYGKPDLADQPNRPET